MAKKTKEAATNGEKETTDVNYTNIIKVFIGSTDAALTDLCRRLLMDSVVDGPGDTLNKLEIEVVDGYEAACDAAALEPLDGTARTFVIAMGDTVLSVGEKLPIDLLVEYNDVHAGVAPIRVVRSSVGKLNVKTDWLRDSFIIPIISENPDASRLAELAGRASYFWVRSPKAVSGMVRMLTSEGEDNPLHHDDNK